MRSHGHVMGGVLRVKHSYNPLCAYCHIVDAALTWTVVGSLAAVAGVIVAIVFGVQGRRRQRLPSAGATQRCDRDERLALGELTQAEKAPVTPGSDSPDRSGGTLPFRNPTFTGRAEALEELESRLAGGPVAVVAVRGLGGVGKSQLALEYAHQMRQSGRYQLAGWVRADSPVTIAEDMAALSPLLGLPGDETVGETAAQVVRALARRRDWLVVFDNAQKPDDLAGMLPPGGGHVLITSRNRVWSGIAAQVDLAEFSRHESVEFVRERSGADEPEAAAELAGELGDLPLALAQAAGYIDTRSMTVHGYLESYRDPVQARKFLDAGLNSAEYPASVARTWLLSFRQLADEHPAAVELLRLCAFLDPDDIDLGLLSAGRAEVGDVLARVLSDRQERAETVGALAAVSLATVPAADHLRVHRLVQAVTRDQLTDDEAAVWTERALNMVAAILPPEPADSQFWPMYARLAPHIEAVTGHPSGSLMPTKRTVLLRKLGIYLTASEQLRAARTTLARVLTIQEEAHGPDHPEVAKDLDNLAAVQLKLGAMRDARALIERALPLLQHAYGADNPEVAKALGNLSIAQRDLWELRDARASIERAQAIFLEAYGPGHPEVAQTFVDLGIVQFRLGELRNARASLEHGLAISEATDRPGQPRVAEALIGLGAVQMRQGELMDARASLEHALVISEELYGPDHAGVAKALIGLGAVQMRQGELMDARASLERALATLQETYGPDHPELASVLINLGAVHMDLSELRNARASIERALTISEDVYGPDHPEVASALINLGIVQLQLGELRNARASIERALTISEDVYGPDHPEVASVLVYLGALQIRQGELGDARASLKRALAISEEVYGPGHPEVAKALIGLAAVKIRQGELRDARASLKRALAISGEVYGPDHLKGARTLIYLGVVRRGKIAKYLFSIFLRLDERQR
jgi:Tfp pilus assembly protein PilF